MTDKDSMDIWMSACAVIGQIAAKAGVAEWEVEMDFVRGTGMTKQDWAMVKRKMIGGGGQ